MSEQGQARAARYKGKVKFYNNNRGFGFLKRNNGEDLFFHFSDVEGNEYLQQNDEVEFEIGEGKEGKSKAVKVKRLEK